MTRRDLLRSSLAMGLVPRSALGLPFPPVADDPKPPKVSVADEFGPLRAAVVHDAANAQDHGWDELGEALEVAEHRGVPHPESGLVSAEKVRREVGAFRALLRKFRVEMLAPQGIAGAPSQLFTRDPLFVVGDTPYLGQLLDEHRLIEFDGLKPIRERLPQIVDLAAEGVLIEGGDVIVLEQAKLVLVGTNLNTNEAGFDALAGRLQAKGAKVHRVPHNRLHLDCCLAPLPDGSALYQRGTMSRKVQPLLKATFRELIPIDAEEASRSLAANLLWLDPENVVSNARAKATNQKLRDRGFQVHALSFRNVTRMWGSFRCATCPIHRD